MKKVVVFLVIAFMLYSGPISAQAPPPDCTTVIDPVTNMSFCRPLNIPLIQQSLCELTGNCAVFNGVCQCIVPNCSTQNVTPVQCVSPSAPCWINMVQGGQIGYCGIVGTNCNCNSPNIACGNGIREGTEVCDGSVGCTSPAYCNFTCSSCVTPVCGNGIREGTEVCDGSVGCTSPAYCNASCSSCTTP